MNTGNVMRLSFPSPQQPHSQTEKKKNIFYIDKLTSSLIDEIT